MRSKNVLNSKSEYNRCRLQRLTINQEDWQPKKDITTEATAGGTEPVEAWEGTAFSNELGEDAAAWRLGPGNKNRKVEKRRRKAEKEDNALQAGKKTKLQRVKQKTLPKLFLRQEEKKIIW